jgi:DNA primase
MEIIDQVRQAANIVEIASQYTTLRARGRKHVGLCPFHSEKTPSFTVDSEKNLFHCFGCGVGGDVFTLVMEKENLSFPEALKSLADRYHITLPEQRRISPQALKLEEQVLKVNEAALAYFKKNLTHTPEGEKAQEYLKKRGIPEDLAEEFKLGYAMNTWDALTASFKAKGTSPSLLEQAGLAVPGRKGGEFYDRFRGRLIFPIFGLTGKVVGFGGRSLFNQEPKYLNSPETPVYAKGHMLYGLNFSKDAIRGAGESILVEGYTDFLSLYRSGFKNCVASLGTALTSQQVGLVQRFAPRIVVNYDGDAAGRTAAVRAVPLCFEKGLETRVLVLPDNLDPDGFLEKHGRDAYLKLLEAAAPGLSFIIDASVAGKRMAVPEVKTKVLRSILELIEAIPDAFVRSEYLTQAAQRLRVDESVLRGLSAGARKGPESGGAADATVLPAEKRLLQIVLEDGEIRRQVLAEVRADDFKGLKSEPVFKIILDWFKKGKDVIFHELQKEIGPPLAGTVSRALADKGQPPTLEEAFDCLCALQVTCKESELKRIQAEIGELGKDGDLGTLETLLRRKQAITKQIMDLR